MPQIPPKLPSDQINYFSERIRYIFKQIESGRKFPRFDPVHGTLGYATTRREIAL